MELITLAEFSLKLGILKLEIYLTIITNRKNFRSKIYIGKKTSFLQHRVW
jgi:hypothetical protein